jgi:hypothetical protein
MIDALFWYTRLVGWRRQNAGLKALVTYAVSP